MARNFSNLPAAPRGKTGWPWTGGPVSECDFTDSPSAPRITIVTPSYNQGEFLEEAIRSVLLQGYPNLEYFIIDGGSTDQSLEILRKYEPWLDHWVSEPDRGQSHALNKGLARATGVIAGWLCADDLLLPGALGAIVELRQQQPKAVVWCGACQDIDREGNPLRLVFPKPGTRSELADWWCPAVIPQSSALFDLQACRAAGLIEERLHFVMDVALWMRLAEQGRFAVTSKILSCNRVYPETKSMRDAPMREVELMAACVYLGEREVARRRLTVRFFEMLTTRQILGILWHNWGRSLRYFLSSWMGGDKRK